jgi:hypothetical protein
LPGSLVNLFPGAPRCLQFDAGTVDELFDRLDDRWPGMRMCLAGAGPTIREHINVFVDGERSPIDLPLRPGSEVYIMTAVSGG